MTPSSYERVLVLGCGYAGTAIARGARARGLEVMVSARRPEVTSALSAEGFDAFRFDSTEGVGEVARRVDARTLVAACFPPDGRTDAVLAPLVSRAARVRYLSSTSVYGSVTGLIDDTTPVPTPEADRIRLLLGAEEAWAKSGATVFRCAAIYGPDRGLHTRVIRGEHKIPGDGRRWLSRIHIDDLALHVLSPVAAPGERFVLGDAEPAPHLEVVRFIADVYGVPMPESVSIERVHHTLRADRRIDAQRARAMFGVVLGYPSYRDGMAPNATKLASPAKFAGPRPPPERV